MTKYGKEIILTATEDNHFRTTKFSVSDCDSPKHADSEIRKWIANLPELPKITGNKKTIDNVLTK